MGTEMRAPVLLDRAVDDPELVDQLVDRHQPYWPVQRYIATGAEYATLSGDRGATELPVAPVFRGDWAVDGRPLPGVEPVLASPRFAAAARQVFGGEIVRPTTVYVNLTWQLPFPQGAGHTDIPAFRGFDRSEHPVAFLAIMGASGLFEDVRVKIATAVSWFYAGGDGGFEYWPDGPDAPPVVHEGAIHNTAVVADNDVLWHRVRPTGRPEDGMVAMGLDSELVRLDGDTWGIVEDGRELARFPREKLRVSLSWKAIVFDDEADRRRHDDHSDDIDLPEVIARFETDLRHRGVDLHLPEDPRRDPTVLRTLQDVYVRYPTTAAA
ncbi:MAG: hypothetical protein ACLFXM_12215 [Acidimicrobiia bacterium]